MDYYVLTPISFVLRIFEAFSNFSLVLVLLSNKNVFTKKHFTGAIIFSIIFEVGKLLIPQCLSGFTALILGIPFIGVYFKEKLKGVTIAYLITGMIVAVLDFLIVFCIKNICGLTTISEIAEAPFLYSCASTFISLGVLIVGAIVCKIKKRKEKDLSNRQKANIGIIINNVLTFLLLIPNLIMLLYYYDKKELPIYIVFINIIAIVAMFFVNTYNTKKGFELVTAEQELITERTYNKTLQNLVDGLRTFKHDYNNTLQTMYGYIQLNNMTELKKFFDQILDESKAITALDKLNPELFRNPCLFGLVTAKYEYSRQNNVTMNFEIYGDLDNINMQIYDFTRILGIFLDNAIEASAGSEKKVVNFLVAERKGQLSIEISNTFSDVGLKVEHIEEKGVSSKGENRGLGLYKVKEILKKYPDVKHTTEVASGMFMQRLAVNKVKVENKKCNI